MTETKRTPRLIVCKKCRKKRKLHAKNLCKLCYARNVRSKSKKRLRVI